MSSLLFIGLLLVCSVSLYFLYRWYDKDGLYVYIVFATLMGLILSLKIIKINNFEAISYFPIYMSIFICIYFMLEKYGKKEIKNALYLVCFTAMIFIIMLGYEALFIPTLSNKILIHTKKLFIHNWGSIIAYVLILIFSIIGSCYLYKYTKKYYDHIFINSAFTTIVVQLVDTLIFTVISYFFALGLNDLFRVGVMTYSFKLMCCILYMPVFYLLMHFKKVKRSE